MKLAHRDFRPPRRSRYVAQPLKRRPTLRILVLAAIGAAVYLKFDAVVSSPVFQNLKHPLRLLEAAWGDDVTDSPKAIASEGLQWSPDSAFLEASCASVQAEPCLHAWKEAGLAEAGALRALLQKTAFQWGIGPLTGFTATYRRILPGKDAISEGPPTLQLGRLILRTAGDSTVLLPAPGGGRSFCAQGKCLDAMNPRAPFTGFLSMGAADTAQGRLDHRTQAYLTPLGGKAFRPILQGRIVDLSMSADSSATGNRMKIYHGRKTFSYYRGFAELRPGLHAGSLVDIGDTLGFMGGKEDSLDALGLGIEKDGLLVDPLAFLGLSPDSARVAP